MSKAGFMKGAVTLFVIALVSGCLLGGVCRMAKEPITRAATATNNRAYKTVFNEAETFESDDALTAVIKGRNTDLASIDFGGMTVENVLKVVDGSGNELDYVITSPSNNSYDDAVKLSVGLKEDGTITRIEFLEINDTPGLGLKAKEPAFRDQFTSKNAQSLSVIKSGNADSTQINVISGAIITSSAITNAVNAVLYYSHDCVNE